ncbi:hypothetical protein Micbo1qcDRAFT_159820, partial [Microdochium bolleyi]
MSTAKPNPSDVYDPDAVLPQNSPVLRPQVVNLKPSPPPPPPCLSPFTKVGPFPGLGHKLADCKLDAQPDPGDAVLIRTLAGGKLPDGTHEELALPLPELGHYRKAQSPDEGSESDESRDDEGVRSSEMSPVPSPGLARSLVLYGPNKLNNAAPVLDLQSLATHAMKFATVVPNSPPEHKGLGTTTLRESPSRTLKSPAPLPIDIPNSKQPHLYGRDPKRSASITSMSPYSLPSLAELHGSPLMAPAQAATHSSEGKLSSEPLVAGPGGLPPIQMASPPSDTNSLPSIRSQFREQLTNGAAGPEQRLNYPQSPPVPAMASRLGSIHGSHGSPPISPNEFYRAGIPSPASSAPGLSPFGFSPPMASAHHASMGGYVTSN